MALTAFITLTKGRKTQVDWEDFVWLSKWKWKTLCALGNDYAVRNTWLNGEQRVVLMSREILGITNSQVQADHKNRDTLDNRRLNLRVATRWQNLANRGKYKNNSSGFKGVTWIKEKKLYRARLMVNGKIVHYSYHKTVLLASEAYQQAAKKWHGEFVSV